ncbi:MAG TPA: acyltransferase family protein [Streptosporangiaceae bacterium]|nr:acyltransferase family protein [Streptosporangiaceae bacterium]
MTIAPPAPAASKSVPASGAPRPRRLAWLDALRGFAALCVVYEHFGARVLPGVHAAVFSVFDPGLYGVLVFFLISGYIVPASLERTGSVRAFWIGRLFRLFPLFVFVIGVTLFLNAFGLASVNGTNQDVTAAVFAHLFMLNDLLGGPNLVVVIWTLSYEMVFYLLLTALFTAGLHRRSGELAVSFGIGALMLGGLLPTGLISYHTLGLTQIALIADGLVMGGLGVALSTRGLTRTVAAWIAACTALVLVVLNGRRFGYEGLTILALMFAGTVLHRAQHGQIRRGWAAAFVAGTFAATMAAGAWHIPALRPGSQAALQQREWVVSIALAGLTFAAGLALQHLRLPSVFAWLGLVSYSVYLGLPLLLDLYDDIPLPQAYQDLWWLQAAACVAFLATLLACAAMTYRLVEVPMQRLGRLTAARLGAGSAATARSPSPRPENGPLRLAEPRHSGSRDSGPRHAGPRDAGPRHAGPRELDPVIPDPGMRDPAMPGRSRLPARPRIGTGSWPPDQAGAPRSVQLAGAIS